MGVRTGLLLVLAGLSGCGGPQTLIRAACPASGEQSCSYVIEKPVGDLHAGPHAFYRDDIVTFRVRLSKDLRIDSLHAQRVPSGEVKVERMRGKTEVPASWTSGYVEIDPRTSTLTIFLQSDRGQFFGNGIYHFGSNIVVQSAVER